MKRILFFFVVMFLALFFTACKDGDEKLTLTFSGADDVTLEYEQEFNVLEGVRVIGSDGKDYSENITYTSLANINKDTHLLDTTQTGEITIKYECIVGEAKVVRYRKVTVNEPERTSMVLNGDFTMGTVGWDKFEADGGYVTLSVEDGALKLEVTSGLNPWTPRISQMGIPFEKDKTYEVSFKAKASVEGKLVHLQVGEILDKDPYFTNFKPAAQVEYVTLTTEWAEYSYKFTHTQDNKRGGLLFEFGTFKDSNISCTVWLDDIDVQESQPDPDTKAPVFSGILPSVTITTDSTFDPLAGVKAEDVVDGDLTDEITVTIYKIEGEEETEVEGIDTSVPGDYKIVYTVEDAAGNVATEEMLLSIRDMIFSETDIIKNGTLADAENNPWTHWADNGLNPTVSFENGEVVITTTAGGDQAWKIQFLQTGLKLEAGKTYKLVFDAKASAVRDINVVFATDAGEASHDTNRKNGFELSETYQTFEFLFTFEELADDPIKISFELGATAKYAAGSVYLDNIKLFEADIDEVLYNKDFDILGWRKYLAEYLSDKPVADLVKEDGALKMAISHVGAVEQSYEIQIIQDALALGTGADNVGTIAFEAGKTYRLSFKAAASVTGKINIAFGWMDGSNWVPYYVTSETDQPEVNTTIASYNLVFTIPAEADTTNKSMFKFELGKLFQGQTGVQYFVVDDVKLEVQGEDDTYSDTGAIVNGSMEDIVGWTLFVDPSAEAEMHVDENGNLVVAVTKQGGEAWHVHLFNGEKTTITRGKYRFVIKASSDVARKIRANLVVPTEGFYSILPGNMWDIEFSGSDTVQVFTKDFEVGTDLLEKVKVEIDFGPIDGSDPATVTFYDIIIYKVF